MHAPASARAGAGLLRADACRTWTPSSSPAAATPRCPKRMKLRDILAQLRAHLRRQHRRRVRARVRLRGAAVAAGRVPGRAPAAALQRRGAPQHSVAAHRRRGPGALPAHQVRGPEALLARGRRCADSAARRSHPAGRRGRHRGGGHRHGASRPPQRAGQPARQVAGGAVLRVRGHVRPGTPARAPAT